MLLQWEQNQTCFSLKMKGEAAFTVSDIYAKCEDVFTERRNWPLTPHSFVVTYRVPGVHVWSGCDSVGVYSLGSSSFYFKLIYTITPLHLVSTCSFLPSTFVGAKEASVSEDNDLAAQFATWLMCSIYRPSKTAVLALLDIYLQFTGYITKLAVKVIQLLWRNCYSNVELPDRNSL